MRPSLLSLLWSDDEGSVLALEWTFVATILVLGAITGLMAARDAVLLDDPAPPAPEKRM
jgi:hypothetical protein